MERAVDLIFTGALIIILVWIAIVDGKTMRIPNRCVVFCFALGVLACFLYPDVHIISRVIGMGIIALPLMGMNLLIKDAFGGGDIKLMAAAGLLLGTWQTVLAFFIAVITGGIAAVGIKIQKKRETHIAFGPYLALGIGISWLFGGLIVNGYWNTVM